MIEIEFRPKCSDPLWLGVWCLCNIGPSLSFLRDEDKCKHAMSEAIYYIITHSRLMALFPGLPGWAGTRKAKPNWILLKQETVSGSGISWAICKSAPRSRQITMPAPHHSVFYRPDALPAAQPTASKHWRQFTQQKPGEKSLLGVS